MRGCTGTSLPILWSPGSGMTSVGTSFVWRLLFYIPRGVFSFSLIIPSFFIFFSLLLFLLIVLFLSLFLFLLYFEDVVSLLPNGYWTSKNGANARSFFYDIASSKGLDPLNPQTWYTLTYSYLKKEVCTFKIMSLMYSLLNKIV